MQGSFVIRPQQYPDASAPLTYAIFLETNEVINDLDLWQDCDGVFVAYSWTEQGAERAIRALAFDVPCNTKDNNRTK